MACLCPGTQTTLSDVLRQSFSGIFIFGFLRAVGLNKVDFIINYTTTINRPFPSSLVPRFQSESKCETILKKLLLICMKVKLHVELIFI